MTKRLVALAVAIVLMNLMCGSSVAAQSSSEKDAQLAAKVKTAIAQLGTGPTARVSVRLRDGSSVEGYVAAAGEDHFDVVDQQNGLSRNLSYAQVKTVKQVKVVQQPQGNNLTKGATKVVIVAGAVVAGIVALFFLQRYDR